MLSLLIAWIVVGLFLLPSVFLLRKAENGKIVLLVILLVYTLANGVHAYFLPGNLSDDVLHWPDEVLWMILSMMGQAMLALFIAFGWKIRKSEGAIPNGKGILIGTILIFLSIAALIVLNIVLDFTPYSDWLRRLAMLLCTAALGYGIFRMIKEMMAVLRVKVYPSVIAGLIFLFPVFGISAFFSVKGTVQNGDQFFGRKLLEEMLTPDKQNAVFFYKVSYAQVVVYTCGNEDILMKKIQKVYSFGSLTGKEITNENLVYDYTETRHGGGGIFSFFRTVSYPKQARYEFKTGTFEVIDK